MKHFVGRDVASARDNGLLRPVSRVTLRADSENVYTAGDDTGYALEAGCPHATQAMAGALLARLRGMRYRMLTAEAAAIDPAAEVGDGMDVDGMYSVLARIRDDGSGYPGLDAPGQAEVEDEYPAAGPLEKAVERKLAETRSSITKSAEEILLQVERTYATQDALASVSVQADKIRWLVKSGESESDFTLTDRAIQLVSETIDLSGFVTFSSLTEPGETTVNGSNIHGGTLTLGGLDDQAGSLEILNSSGKRSAYMGCGGLSIERDAGMGRNGIRLAPGMLDFNPGGTPVIASAGSSSSVGRSFDFLVDLDSYPFNIRPSSALWNSQTRERSGYTINEDPVFRVDRYWDSHTDTMLYRASVNGTLVCSGSKSRAVDTADYGRRLLYCCETPSPLFGDVGGGTLDGDGACAVYLDDVFAQTVSPVMDYQVFLQAEGAGALWVERKERLYFLVRGTPGLSFAWAIAARQRDYDYTRLEPAGAGAPAFRPVDWAGEYQKEIGQLIKQREAY